MEHIEPLKARPPAAVTRLALLSTFLCLACLIPPASANDGAIRGVGGAIKPMEEHPSVIMRSETVDITIAPTGAHVRCVFNFYNDGPEQDVRMGFPETRGGAAVPKDRAIRAMGIDLGFVAFKSFVDGQPVETQIVEDEDNDQYDILATRWRTKTVHFAPGQTRKVEVRYQSGFGSSVVGDRSFWYQVETGASWKGNIDYARFTTRFVGMKGYSTSDGSALTDRVVTKVLRNFEPKRGLYYSFFPPAPPLVVNGKAVAYDLKHAPLPRRVWYGNLYVPASWFARQIGATVRRGQGGYWIIRRGSKVYRVKPVVAPDLSSETAEASILRSKLFVSVPDVVKALGGHTEEKFDPQRGRRVAVTLPPVD